MLFNFGVFFSALSFSFFGLHCLMSNRMKLEFARFGMPKFRLFTGAVEAAAAAGLCLGLFQPLWGILASAGLIILMAVGLVVRLKLRDGLVQAAPAFFYLCLNTYLMYKFINIG
jgi:hypothetical protein